ncbi:MAG: carotenoid biosynthesis protein [Nonlabens sp.]|uniref:carotenoid biosynthesis protein n=1 Tax=Nonlabens sp. TaxID=1888209 RepID=UPI003EF60B7C
MKRALIIFLWVVHISALIGIALGYSDFFVEKSPFTLLYLALVLFLYYPIDSVKKTLLFGLCFIVGMGSEWIGVHTSYLFGNYHYGIHLGPKIDGIPLLIGINWGILTFISHAIATSFIKNKWIQIIAGATLMVFLDFFLEQICDYAGFWHFDDGAGWFNYVCWFVIAALLHLILAYYKLRGDRNSSLHLYTVQLIFASGLWIIITT